MWSTVLELNRIQIHNQLGRGHDTVSKLTLIQIRHQQNQAAVYGKSIGFLIVLEKEGRPNPQVRLLAFFGGFYGLAELQASPNRNSYHEVEASGGADPS